MSEYIYENVPHPKCDEAGCMEPGWFAWDGVLRCRRHHAALEDLVSREKATETRLERLEDKLYVELVMHEHKMQQEAKLRPEFVVLTDAELEHYSKKAKRYASFLVGYTNE